MALIEARGIHKSFRLRSPSFGGQVARHVLRDVSLSVAEGEFVSIVGAMGSGKSTLLAILAGLIPADAGEVLVNGTAVAGVRQDSSYVFQNYSLLPWFSALENVRLAISAACPSLPKSEQIARAHQTLEQVGLGNAIHRRPSQLSGGMRQRVALARAFASEPRVLFMDEPFGALDALTRATLQRDLVALCAARSITTVMITNSVEEAILLSDRIVPMLPGPPATLGPPIPVDLARPRSVAQLAHDEDAMRVRADVVATLTAALAGRTRRAAAIADGTAAPVTLAPEEAS